MSELLDGEVKSRLRDEEEDIEKRVVDKEMEKVLGEKRKEGKYKKRKEGSDVEKERSKKG